MFTPYSSFGVFFSKRYMQFNFLFYCNFGKRTYTYTRRLQSSKQTTRLPEFFLTECQYLIYIAPMRFISFHTSVRIFNKSLHL